jgi:hypothetical protein
MLYTFTHSLVQDHPALLFPQAKNSFPIGLNGQEASPDIIFEN